MARFSERLGYVGLSAIQFEVMDEGLRNSLWNFIDANFFETDESWFFNDAELKFRANIIYDRFHRKPIRSLHAQIDIFVRGEFAWLSSAKWYEVYDYCEFVLNNLGDNLDRDVLAGNLNWVLEREKSGYRFIGNCITPIVESEQIEALQNALDSARDFRAAATHIKSALSLYAARKSPDYRNSIKESISAVESVAKIISGKDSATLSDAIRIIDAKAPIHEAFRQALVKLYGYTSDEKGIRHALLDEANIDEADARFMIVACSAFVSYLISRAKL